MAEISKETGRKNGKTLADFKPKELRLMAKQDRPVKLGQRSCLCRSFRDAKNPEHRMMRVIFPVDRSETTVHLRELILNGD